MLTGLSYVPLASPTAVSIVSTLPRVDTACSIGVGHAGPIITLPARNGAAASEPPRHGFMADTTTQTSPFRDFSATQRFRGTLVPRVEGGGRGDGLKFAGKTDNAVILEQAAKFAECSGESRLNYVFPRR